MGNEDSKLRRLFESFDHDNDGQLGLNEILQINKIHDLKYILKSPSLLYQIDEGQDGKLNFEEFAKLLRHLKSKNKTKVKEKKKDKKIWTAVSEEDAKDFQLSRSTETPMFTNSNYGSGGDDEDKIKGKQPMMSDEEKENEKLEEEKQVINEENKNFLINILSTAKGRRRYMNWLFRLADVEGKGSINSDQLGMILKALQLDGVNIKELSYDQSQEKAISGIAKKLMEEYDGDNDGRITQEEFLIFADLVVKNYQLEEEEEMIMGRYVLKRKLGSGASGVVKLAWDNKRNEKVAIKIIKKGTLSDMSRVDKEIQAMLMLSHPSIVSLYKVLQSDTEVYLVMEYCSGGTLADYVQLKPLSEELSRFYFAQVVEGVRYCHISGVVHRDLKLENLLLTKNGNIKITDFGHVGIFTQGWDMFSTTMVGSLFHLSPEQIEGKIYSGEKIDIWALGVVLYRMIVGKPPFYDKNVNKLVENIKNIKLEIPESPPISEQAKKLMVSIFKAEPKDRVSIEEIQRHEWVINGEKIKPSLERMEMILGKPDENSQEEAWKVLTFVIKNKMNMTFHEKVSKTPHILKTCNCIFPAKDLKLSIHIKKMETLPSSTPSSLNLLLHTITSTSYHSPKTLSFSPKNGSGNGSNKHSPKQSHSPKQTNNINNRLSGEGSNVVYRNNPLPKLINNNNNNINGSGNYNEEKNISDKENLNRSKSLSLTNSPTVNRNVNQSSSLHNITVSNNFNQFSSETPSILPPNSLLFSTNSTNDTFGYNNDNSGTSYNSGNVRSIFSNSLEDFTFSPILLSLHKHDKKDISSSGTANNDNQSIQDEREELKVRGMTVENSSVDSSSQSLKLSTTNTDSLISSTDTLTLSDLSLLTDSRTNISTSNHDLPFLSSSNNHLPNQNDNTDIPLSKTNISITTTNISIDNSDVTSSNSIISTSNTNLLNVNNKSNNNLNNVNNNTFSGALKRTSNSEKHSHHSSLPVQPKSPNSSDFLHPSHLHMLSSNEKLIPTPPGSNNKVSSENYFFIFDLREGDCWDFRNTVERIQNHYSSSFQLFKKGLLQLEEEENKDLFSSEPTLSFNALSSLSSSPNQKDKKKRLSKNMNETNKVNKSSPHKKKVSTGNSNNISKDELPNYAPLQNSSDSSPNSPTKSISPSSPERKKSSVVSLPISDDEGSKTCEKNWKSKSTGGFITRDSKIPKKDKQKDREKEDKKDKDRKEKDKKKDKDKEKKKNSESK